jgi:fimbrial chaperone protein
MSAGALLRFALAAILTASAFGAAPAYAAFGLVPVSMTLSARAPITSFTITNRDAVGKVVQVKVYSWDQAQGREILADTNDVIVSPPVFSLSPLDRQIIRVGVRRKNTTTERAYRIIIMETPAAIQARVAMAVAFRVSVPVFVEATAPAGGKPEWSVRTAGPHAAIVTVKNVGPTHLHVLGLALRDGARELSTLKEATYVLPGEEREWRMDVKGALEPRAVALQVDTDGITQKVPLVVKP